MKKLHLNKNNGSKYLSKRKLLPIGTAAIALAFVLASEIVIQPVFAHSHIDKTLNVSGAGQRGLTIVLGHTNEPVYGAKPGIEDGKHSLEVLLSDNATKLPLTGAQLKVDKYYFKDFNSFQEAKTVDNATEIQKNITVGPVFGDSGHYMTTQVVAPGIYGYRLYGTISYFSVATLNVNTTVFCTSTEGNTSKFNSPGWTGSFGCPEDIDTIFFPRQNNDTSADSDAGNGQGNNTAVDFNLGSSEIEGGVKQTNNIPASVGTPTT